MIKRIVKMTVKPESVDQFLEVYQQAKEKIVQLAGIKSLELVRDIHRNDVFMTISKWQSERDLENYRKSELFMETWPKIKYHFAEKAEAWSVTEIFEE